MAFSKVPTAWIPSYDSDGTNITIPIASLPGLVSGDADPATGDIRKIVYALLAKLNAAWIAAGANIPVEWQQSQGQALNPANGTITATFNNTFNLTPGSVGVTAEPT